jgi:hypothetical protein
VHNIKFFNGICGNSVVDRNPFAYVKYPTNNMLSIAILFVPDITEKHRLK